LTGGTVDITVHEVLADNKVKEIHCSSGHWGGTKVDSYFQSTVRTVFGKDFIDEFSRRYPQDWFKMLKEFELLKRSLKPDGKSMSIGLSYNLGKMYILQ
jgi:hypothetical protein